jgi:hypothetical protein
MAVPIMKKVNQREYARLTRLAFPERHRQIHAKYRQLNPERTKARDAKANIRSVLKNHGMTLDQYEKMLQHQKGVCAICGEISSRRLCFDHNHSTGKVRGLLCSKCNFGIGQFNDDIELLMAAAVYLTDTLEV